MRLLDRYLLRELIVPFVYCLVGFLIFWVSSDIFAQLSDFQKFKLTARDVFQYYTIRTPEMLVTVLPVAFLLALLYTLTNHARHHELTAIRAAGVSLLRLSMPYLGMGVLLSFALFAINELWVPRSLEACEEILSRHQPKVVSSSIQRQREEQLGFYRQVSTNESRWWMVDSYSLRSGEMSRPHVVWILPDGSRQDILAESASHIDGRWLFTNVLIMNFPKGSGSVPEPVERETLSMPVFTETPEQIRSEIKINKINNLKSVRKVQLSIKEILNYKRLHPGDTTKATILDTKLHGRLAAPWTCFVVVLIALPFGAASGRRNVAVGVASSILIGFVYFVLQQLALALGTGGYVAPWLAAWSPNAFFAIVGLVLTWRVR
jgi:lipopolysaccharide export system permease protein